MKKPLLLSIAAVAFLLYTPATLGAPGHTSPGSSGKTEKKVKFAPNPTQGKTKREMDKFIHNGEIDFDHVVVAQHEGRAKGRGEGLATDLVNYQSNKRLLKGPLPEAHRHALQTIHQNLEEKLKDVHGLHDHEILKLRHHSGDMNSYNAAKKALKNKHKAAAIDRSDHHNPHVIHAR